MSIEQPNVGTPESPETGVPTPAVETAPVVDPADLAARVEAAGLRTVLLREM